MLPRPENHFGFSKWKGYLHHWRQAHTHRTVKFWTVAFIYIHLHDRWSNCVRTVTYQLQSSSDHGNFNWSKTRIDHVMCAGGGVIICSSESSWNLDEIWMKFGWFHPSIYVCLFVFFGSHASNVFFLSFLLLVLRLEASGMDVIFFHTHLHNERQVE
jgi:hypothetical protein